jgi:hypothetical protein
MRHEAERLQGRLAVSGRKPTKGGDRRGLAPKAVKVEADPPGGGRRSHPPGGPPSSSAATLAGRVSHRRSDWQWGRCNGSPVDGGRQNR